MLEDEFTVGTVELDSELGGKQYVVEMVVADLRTEGILGLDFLETNKCASGLPHETMKLRTNQSHCIERDQSQENVSVVLANDISIPGNTEMEHEAVIQGEVTGGTIMSERIALLQKPSTLLATSVVNTQENTKKSTGTNTRVESVSR